MSEVAAGPQGKDCPSNTVCRGTCDRHSPVPPERRRTTPVADTETRAAEVLAAHHRTLSAPLGSIRCYCDESFLTANGHAAHVAAALAAAGVLATPAPERKPNACAACLDCYHPSFGPNTDGDPCPWCRDCGCAESEHAAAPAPDTAAAEVLAIPSEDAMQHFLDALNVSGLHPELACVTSRGTSFLAGLTEPDADHVHITATEGDTGTVHCCECVHPGERANEWDPNSWEPTYPVYALVAEWPDLDRVVENEFPAPWWAAAGVLATPAPDTAAVEALEPYGTTAEPELTDAELPGPSCEACGHLIGVHSHESGCMDSMVDGFLERDNLGFCPCAVTSLTLIRQALAAHRETAPTALYHWSPSRNRASIGREGLRPGSPSNMFPEWIPPHICYGETPSAALGLTLLDDELDLWMVYTGGHAFTVANDGAEWRCSDRVEAWWVGSRPPRTPAPDTAAVEALAGYLAAMDQAGGVYTKDFRDGFRHALAMSAAYGEQSEPGRVRPEVREAAQVALDRAALAPRPNPQDHS